MRSRFLPYAATPGRLAIQLLSDILITLWTTLWVLVGLAVHAAISSFAKFGRQVNTSSTDIAHNFDSAGQRAEHIPLLGIALSKPLVAAGDAAHDIAAAGHNLDTTATWLAVVLALAVAAPPALAFVVPWLIRRVRFFRRKWTMIGLAATPAGEQLLALRALSNRPLRRLARVNVDPIGGCQVSDWLKLDSSSVGGGEP